MKKLYEQDYLIIFLDNKNKWMYARWIDDQTKESVQAGCDIMLQLAKEHNLTQVLNDNREVTTSWATAAEWVGTQWFPAMLSAGVRHFAWIYSPFAFSQLSADTSISYARSSPEIATFNNQEEAEKWLLARKNKNTVRF